MQVKLIFPIFQEPTPECRACIYILLDHVTVTIEGFTKASKGFPTESFNSLAEHVVGVKAEVKVTVKQRNVFFPLVLIKGVTKVTVFTFPRTTDVYAILLFL